METGLWMSYDLGVQGDYSHLYEWLDDLGAVECGNSVAFFKYECTSLEKSLEELKQDLMAKVSLNPQNRIYVVFQKEKGSFVGRFIFGKRKANPWEGYSKQGETEEDK